jgi:hypothetical protein
LIILLAPDIVRITSGGPSAELIPTCAAQRDIYGLVSVLAVFMAALPRIGCVGFSSKLHHEWMGTVFESDTNVIALERVDVFCRNGV